MAHPQPRQQQPVVTNRVETILGWPTDTVSIDFLPPHNDNEQTMPPVVVHTVLLFVPGNPGLVGWYVPMLREIVRRLGPGYACRGVSYAGHGLTDETVRVEDYEKSGGTRDTKVCWSVNGQVRHKIAWMDGVQAEFSAAAASWIFVSHSIGAHMVQRLCVVCPNVLRRTVLFLHWMPFVRMDSYRHKQWLLSTVANHPQTTIGLGKQVSSRLFGNLPQSLVDAMLQTSVPDGRDIAVTLLRTPTFARNFFELGLEEIRDVPQAPDVSTGALDHIGVFWFLPTLLLRCKQLAAYRLLGQQCPVCILFAGNDQWAPEFHQSDLERLQAQGLIPSGSIRTTLLPRLVHAFVVVPWMVDQVVEYSLDNIASVVGKHSKL